jgi:hypothetical protein
VDFLVYLAIAGYQGFLDITAHKVAKDLKVIKDLQVL